GENYLRLLERVLDLLSRSGAPREQLAWGVDTLLQLATATAAEHSTQLHAPTTADDWNALAVALHAVDEATQPAIKAHMPALLGGSVEDRWRWNLDVLVNGIAHTPVPGGAAD